MNSYTLICSHHYIETTWVSFASVSVQGYPPFVEVFFFFLLGVLCVAAFSVLVQVSGVATVA